MKYSIVVAIMAVLLAACVAQTGDGLPTITEERAINIAQGDGEVVDSRLVQAVPEGQEPSGYADLAWEVQVLGEGTFSIVYVSALDGSILYTSVTEIEMADSDDMEDDQMDAEDDEMDDAEDMDDNMGDDLEDPIE